jgi:hypothetical protein
MGNIIIAGKESILNYAFNRWGLNRRNSVGNLSEEIRKCMPDTVSDWKIYYEKNVFPLSRLDDLGRRLFDSIKDVIAHEIRFHPDLVSSITIEDCKSFVKEVVFERTFNGYKKEVG